MKKINLLYLAFASLLVCGCGDEHVTIDDYSPTTIDLSFENNSAFNQTTNKNDLGSFNLLTPSANSHVTSDPTFTWEPCDNASTYTLEVCTLSTFPNNNDSVPYIKESNISTTSFKLSTKLKLKNTTYYWRVTAVNPFNKTASTKLCNTVFSFVYDSLNAGEIDIDIGEAEDWTRHEVGSYGEVTIDRNDFFGTGNSNSVVFTFDKEHTNQGIVLSDGWLIFTRNLDMDLYGTDSLYFNFYYSGNDAQAVIRIIDSDGEYWFKNIQISQNAKQTVLMKFDEFVQRTNDVTVQNETFDYEHIQALEIVFEKSFGDGCCVLGGIKAVNYSDYSDMFISSFDFNSFESSSWVDDNYTFDKQVSADGSELILTYSNKANYGNDAGINGYGFKKITLNRYFTSGNALKFKVKYTGYKDNSSNAVIRIYEEDKDRWSYEQPLSSLVLGEYAELTVPFCAFASSQVEGDGNRQFGYILNIQFGVSGVYGSGTISFKDVEVVATPDLSTNKRIIDSTGVIEDFDNYSYRSQIYENWEQSKENKDEGIFVDSTNKYNNGVNQKTGLFYYKSDMGMATYDTYIDVQYEGGNSIKFWAKDASSKSDNASLLYLKKSDVAAKMTIQLALKDGRWYRYTIEKLNKLWTEYVISFDDFELFSGVETDVSDPFVSQNVVNFAFGVQYFYYTQQGKSFPVYTSKNNVFVDEIKFVKDEATVINALEEELHLDESGTTVLIDDMEYASEAALKNRWFGTKGYDYENVHLSNNVSSEGGSHSMQLDYNGYVSPSYATYPVFGDDVTAKALVLDICGDNKATMYINFYIKSGTSAIQYRYTITLLESGWHRYAIGFSLFAVVEGTGGSLTTQSFLSLQKMTFGLVDNDGGSVSSVYIDNVKTDNTKALGYYANTVTPLS